MRKARANQKRKRAKKTKDTTGSIPTEDAEAIKHLLEKYDGVRTPCYLAFLFLPPYTVSAFIELSWLVCRTTLGL